MGLTGETHQGIFDMSFLNAIPNLVIMAPKNFKELEDMLDFAIKLNKPVFIRYPRGVEEYSHNKNNKIEFGKAEIIKEGKDLTIIAIGKMVNKAYRIAKVLEKEKIYCEVINARFLKPLDENLIFESLKKTKRAITIEDGILSGGIGESVIKLCNKKNINIQIKTFGYEDCFIEHGSNDKLEEKYISDDKIIKEIKNSFTR